MKRRGGFYDFNTIESSKVDIKLLSTDQEIMNGSSYKVVESNSDYILPPMMIEPNGSQIHQFNQYTSHFLLYFIIAFCMISLVLAMVFLVVYVLKRAKLNRLRHHLMPLYKFDPGDDEPQMQADLLEDDRDQQMSRSSNQMKLKFNSQTSDPCNV